MTRRAPANLVMVGGRPMRKMRRKPCASCGELMTFPASTDQDTHGGECRKRYRRDRRILQA
jgi:hypothetical protein